MASSNYYSTAETYSQPGQQPTNGYPQNTEGYVRTDSGNFESYGPAGDGFSSSSALEVVCGPLLNFKDLRYGRDGAGTWCGSVLIVTKSGQQQPPQLELSCLGAVHHSGSQNGHTEGSGIFDGERLYEDLTKAFWRFRISCPLQPVETRWQYHIPNITFVSGQSSRLASTRAFVVPAKDSSMRIMFHSCNGFSVGTDEDFWSGPALWNDVLRTHEQKPFHVMIGGGDQIYNDGVRVTGPLKEWTDIGNPQKRRTFPFGEELRAKCDAFYFDNYTRWYSTGAFAIANAQIPQINIWDDHDIIDGERLFGRRG